jgi:hypothetical protein
MGSSPGLAPRCACDVSDSEPEGQLLSRLPKSRFISASAPTIFDEPSERLLAVLLPKEPATSLAAAICFALSRSSSPSGISNSYILRLLASSSSCFSSFSSLSRLLSVMIESSLNYSNTIPICGTTGAFFGYFLFRGTPLAVLGPYLPGPDVLWSRSCDSISVAVKHCFLFTCPGLGRGKSYLI